MLMMLLFLFVCIAALTAVIVLAMRWNIPESLALTVPLAAFLLLVIYHIMVSPEAQCIQKSLEPKTELSEFCKSIVDNKIKADARFREND